MRRMIVALLCAAGGLAGVGCSSLKYEEKRPDGGLISFEAGKREEALAQLNKDYGAVEIVAEYDPKLPKPGGPFDPNAPVKPSERLAASGGFGNLFAASDEGKMHIRFNKKATTGMTPPGLPPAPTDSGVMQAGYRSMSGTGGSALPTPDMNGTAGMK